MIREATEEERKTLPMGEAVFVAPAGHVCVSRVTNPAGQQVWIHELASNGDPHEAVSLLARARKQCRDWGFQTVWANVADAGLAQALLNNGFTLEQIVLKGDI